MYRRLWPASVRNKFHRSHQRAFPILASHMRTRLRLSVSYEQRGPTPHSHRQTVDIQSRQSSIVFSKQVTRQSVHSQDNIQSRVARRPYSRSAGTDSATKIVHGQDRNLAPRFAAKINVMNACFSLFPPDQIEVLIDICPDPRLLVQGARCSLPSWSTFVN